MNRGCVSGFYTCSRYIFSLPFPWTHTFFHQNASHTMLRRIFTDKKWRLEKKKIRWCVKTVGLWTTLLLRRPNGIARLLCGHHHKLGKEPATTKTGFIFMPTLLYTEDNIHFTWQMADKLQSVCYGQFLRSVNYLALKKALNSCPWHTFCFLLFEIVMKIVARK